MIIFKRIKNLSEKEHQEKDYLLNSYQSDVYKNLFIDIGYCKFLYGKDLKTECRFFYILFNIDRYEYIELFKGLYDKEKDLFYVMDKEIEEHI